MKTYSVTLHMDNGDTIYLNPMTAENDVKLLSTIMMDDVTTTPVHLKFGRATSEDRIACYCVGKVSHILYKEA